ncbi:hypothetical protein Rcae01_05035 [Novipirellula caenicola]|uniref:Uncharacterized protein n=1 Tax=Novipirellula caenicola TaxID=1536901 RepID=A0ABP9VWL0_9BACT
MLGGIPIDRGREVQKDSALTIVFTVHNVKLCAVPSSPDRVFTISLKLFNLYTLRQHRFSKLILPTSRLPHHNIVRAHHHAGSPP